MSPTFPRTWPEEKGRMRRVWFMITTSSSRRSFELSTSDNKWVRKISTYHQVVGEKYGSFPSSSPFIGGVQPSLSKDFFQ